MVKKIDLIKDVKRHEITILCSLDPKLKCWKILEKANLNIQQIHPRTLSLLQ